MSDKNPRPRKKLKKCDSDEKTERRKRRKRSRTPPYYSTGYCSSDEDNPLTIPLVDNPDIWFSTKTTKFREFHEFKIPDDLLCMIFIFLDRKDIHAWLNVNKRFYEPPDNFFRLWGKVNYGPGSMFYSDSISSSSSSASSGNSVHTTLPLWRTLLKQQFIARNHNVVVPREVKRSFAEFIFTIDVTLHDGKTRSFVVSVSDSESERYDGAKLCLVFPGELQSLLLKQLKMKNRYEIECEEDSDESSCDEYDESDYELQLDFFITSAQSGITRRLFHHDGVYWIKPTGRTAIQVYCEFNSFGGWNDCENLRSDRVKVTT